MMPDSDWQITCSITASLERPADVSREEVRPTNSALGKD